MDFAQRSKDETVRDLITLMLGLYFAAVISDRITEYSRITDHEIRMDAASNQQWRHVSLLRVVQFKYLTWGWETEAPTKQSTLFSPMLLMSTHSYQPLIVEAFSLRRTAFPTEYRIELIYFNERTQK